MNIKHGDRPVRHDNLGFAQTGGTTWHLISFETWNNSTFCGRQITGDIERFVTGDVCDVCSQLMGIHHSEFQTA